MHVVSWIVARSRRRGFMGILIPVGWRIVS